MRGEVGHATAKAGRTKSPAFARERDEPTRAATVASDAKKSMSQDAALEECFDFVDHESW
jgi:hypothetical protein